MSAVWVGEDETWGPTWHVEDPVTKEDFVIALHSWPRTGEKSALGYRVPMTEQELIEKYQPLVEAMAAALVVLPRDGTP